MQQQVLGGYHDYTNDRPPAPPPTFVQVREAWRLALAQELEDLVVRQFIALDRQLEQLQRAGDHMPGGDGESVAADLDVVRQELFAIIQDLHAQVAQLHANECIEPQLTMRELTILRLLATGQNNRVIAQMLQISMKTVEKHVGNLYAKLAISSRAEAAAWAVRKRLI